MFILIVVDNIERHKTGLQARVIDGEIHSFKSYMCVCIYIYIYTTAVLSSLEFTKQATCQFITWLSV